MLRKYRQKFHLALRNSLLQGTSPEQVSLTITLGFLFGIIPIIGVTTVILALLAFRLKLNMIIIQLANYAVYPLQILLLIPFYKAGQVVFQGPQIATGFQEIYHAFITSPLLTFLHFWQLTLQGTVVWLLLSAPAGFLLYYLILLPVRKLSLRLQSGIYKKSA